MTITFNALSRQMYWTDDSADTIERSSMDGTSRRALHSTSLSNPYGLTLDIDTQTLYWTDYSRNVLEKSNADGTSRAILTNRRISDPYFLTYYDGNLYWGDWAYNRLLTTSVSSPDNVEFFGRSIGTDVYGIHVISPEIQRQGCNSYIITISIQSHMYVVPLQCQIHVEMIMETAVIFVYSAPHCQLTTVVDVQTGW